MLFFPFSPRRSSRNVRSGKTGAGEGRGASAGVGTRSDSSAGEFALACQLAVASSSSQDEESTDSNSLDDLSKEVKSTRARRCLNESVRHSLCQVNEDLPLSGVASIVEHSKKCDGGVSSDLDDDRKEVQSMKTVKTSFKFPNKSRKPGPLKKVSTEGDHSGIKTNSKSLVCRKNTRRATSVVQSTDPDTDSSCTKNKDISDLLACISESDFGRQRNDTSAMETDMTEELTSFPHDTSNEYRSVTDEAVNENAERTAAENGSMEDLDNEINQIVYQDHSPMSSQTRWSLAKKSRTKSYPLEKSLSPKHQTRINSTKTYSKRKGKLNHLSIFSKKRKSDSGINYESEIDFNAAVLAFDRDTDIVVPKPADDTGDDEKEDPDKEIMALSETEVLDTQDVSQSIETISNELNNCNEEVCEEPSPAVSQDFKISQETVSSIPSTSDDTWVGSTKQQKRRITAFSRFKNSKFSMGLSKIRTNDSSDSQQSSLIGSPNEDDPYRFQSTTPIKPGKQMKTKGLKKGKAGKKTTDSIPSSDALVTSQVTKKRCVKPKSKYPKPSLASQKNDHLSSQLSVNSVDENEIDIPETSQEFESLHEKISEAEDYDLVFSQDVRNMQQDAGEIVYVEPARKIASPETKKQMREQKQGSSNQNSQLKAPDTSNTFKDLVKSKWKKGSEFVMKSGVFDKEIEEYKSSKHQKLLNFENKANAVSRKPPPTPRTMWMDNAIMKKDLSEVDRRPCLKVVPSDKRSLRKDAKIQCIEIEDDVPSICSATTQGEEG